MFRHSSTKSACLVGVAIAAMMLPTAAMSASAAPPMAADEPGWVHGVVVDGDGEPVVGDLVNVLGPREVPEGGIIGRTDRRTWTDENGEFRVRQADMDGYPDGYLVQICDIEPDRRRSCLETALGVDHMITYVGPTGVTDSWVTQSRLFPVTGADRELGTVTVKPQGFVHGHVTGGGAFQPLQIQRLNGTVAYYNRTDEQGDYRFQGMAPGRYRIAAGGREVGALPWLSDVITVRAGRDLTVDATLDFGADVHGVVRSAGEPVRFLDIVLTTPQHKFVAFDTTDSKGRYDITGLLPGTYRLGIFYDGSEYERGGVTVEVPSAHASVLKDVAVTTGAVVTVAFESGGEPASLARDELRDSTGRPILANLNDGTGHVRYTGLAPGDYTIVAANHTRYVMAKVHVTERRTYDLGVRNLHRPTLTISGVTAPHAIVEAKTGQECPPDGDFHVGAFHFIEAADDTGHYVLTGVVPGLYMLGADAFPANYAPRCVPDVTVVASTSRDLPLQHGSTVSGRLVYAASGRPVITSLAYELRYPPSGGFTNPTSEHPARGRTRAATGFFSIDRLAAGTVTGQLASKSDENALGQRFTVIFPFQDGTPYYLTSKRQTIDIARRTEVDLADIPLQLHG